MGMATLNVRMPEELKDRGMQVLKREGLSVSDLMRDIFSYLEENQEVPEFAAASKQGMSEADIAKRRAAMQSLVGILPPDVDVKAARHERLMGKTRPGVRI